VNFITFFTNEIKAQSDNKLSTALKKHAVDHAPCAQASDTIALLETDTPIATPHPRQPTEPREPEAWF